MKFIKPFLIIAFLVIVTVVYAVQSREIESRLNTGNVKISTGGEFDIVQMDGPIDFSHKGHSIKGNSATLKLINDDSNEEWTPYELEVFGNIKYDDNADYKATCKSAVFNFTSETMILSGIVSLKGNNIALDAAKVTYNKKDKKLQAEGSVHFESQTKYSPLYDASNSTDELVTYTLDCESLTYIDSLQTVSAASDVTFLIGETGISCQKADITLDDNEIRSVVCEGDVNFYDSNMTGTADIVKYDKSAMTIVFLSNSPENDVLLTYKGQDLRGKKVTVTLGDEREIILDQGTISVNATE